MLVVGRVKSSADSWRDDGTDECYQRMFRREDCKLNKSRLQLKNSVFSEDEIVD